MNKVLLVGCGDLGATVAMLLARLGLETIGLKRSPANIEGVRIIQADVTQTETLNPLEQIQAAIVIYCVAANGQTDEQYKAQYVDGFRNVLATQKDNPKLQHVFFVSSSRVYGQTTHDLLDEADAAIPADFGGERLLEAENLLKNITCKSTVLRLSGIYGPGRLRMLNLAKSPNNWPVQNSWTNRIHRDDAAAFMVFLVQLVLAGNTIKPCYIVTDSKPVSQYEVLGWIADRLATPKATNIPLVEGGKRLSNQTMRASGFKLQYPDFKSGYQALLAAN
ncbi:MAG: sugar nucleotide-binding protein [Methylotenera sp.]|nr:sugar nucleotide-binding protein [Methylotenera sp.]